MATAPRLPPAPVSWPLLPLPDAGGRLVYPTLDASVRQAIRVILQTRPGEQLMRPEFGAGLEEFVHEQNTLTTRRRIRDVVVESLERWEPRITVERVDVWEQPERPTDVRVEIAYRLRRTRAAQQLGLRMTLES